MRRIVLTECQFHRYLSDAYKRGADHQRDGEVREEHNLRYAQAEGWAHEYIDLRLEKGLIEYEEPSPE